MKKIDGIYDIILVLCSMHTEDWMEVHKAIVAGGSGHAFAPDVDFGEPAKSVDAADRIYAEAVVEAETSLLMKRAARNLHDNLNEAMRRILRAERDIQDLKDLGDIEFLEGDGDIEKFLKDAARLLRTVQKLKHTDEAGDLK